MGCTILIQTADCFGDRWKMCRGVYWSLNGAKAGRYAYVIMSRNGGSCPDSGSEKKFYLNKPDTFDEFTVNVFYAGDSIARIEVWRTSELEPVNEGFGFGKAEITQTNIINGLIFNVGSYIECSLRVMNTGEDGNIYGAVGLGYQDKEGAVFFTGKYMIDSVEISAGETFTWNPSIEVLHKDYAAREMTPRGPAIYFMSGHDENGKVVWDRSEYIPVALELESGYVDPLDPEGVPKDWPEPIVKPAVDDEVSDLMPFLYIGFIGFIGYMLLRSQ